MNLSSDLISQFVKVTNDKTETKKESTVYGTAVEHDGAMYVKIDGSELLTPVETTTDMKNGERVTVMIKNHTATVTGNISSPAARTDTVKEVDGKVKEVSDQISDFEIVVADKVSTEELDAEKARIDELKADNVTINEKLTANEAYISKIEAENVKINGKLEASEAEIETIKAEKLDVTTANAKYASIENLEATDAEIYNLKGTYAEFVDLATEKFEASEADISKLRADMLTVEDADIKYADIDELDAANAKITNLESDYGNFKNLTAENFKAVNANIENADLKYANIDFSNIGKATMEYFYAQSGLIKDVTVGDQTITGHLVGVTISGDLIEGNTIKAEKLVIKGSDGLYYQLNTDGMVTEAEQTDQNSLNGSIIRAKSITASKISVTDLVAFGATIGGFHITDNSIFSGVKETVGNNTRGIYLDNDGQIAFGDSSNFVKFYKNASGNYKLAIAADELLIGSSGENISDVVRDAQTSANDASAAAANAQAAAESAQEGIDNLQVGGRNLILGSDTTVSFTATGTAVVDGKRAFSGFSSEHTKIKVGDTVTLSFHLKATNAVLSGTSRIGFEPFAYKDSTSIQYLGCWKWIPVNTEFNFDGVVYATYVLDLDLGVTPLQNTNAYAQTLISGTVEMSNFKLEKGTIATDWTPAPEDIENRVSEAETQIIKNKDAIALTATRDEMNAAIKVAADGISSEVSSLKSKVQWVTDVWVDATAYDQSLWIPFKGNGLPLEHSVRISVTAALNTNCHPSWATHGSGFSVEFEVEDIGNGWGVNTWNQRILADKFNWCNTSPVSYTQLGYGSIPVLYLRGGGKYRVMTSYECNWTGYPDGYIWTSGEYSQSAPTHTSRPTPSGTNLYADMSETKSKISQQADSITAVVAKANQNETDISSLKLTSNAFEVRFGTVEGDVDEAIDKATQAQESFDNLEVGGRNYLTNAKRLNNWTRIVGTASWNVNHADCPNGVHMVGEQGEGSQLRLSNVITGNGYWTVSFEIKGSQSTAVGFYIDICDLGRTRISCNTSNTWEKRSVTVNVTNYTSDIYHFVDFENISWAYIFVRNIKIEKGTKATDWSPAPEDVDSAIDSAQSTADTALGNANLAQSTADGVKTDLANNYTKKTIPDTRNDNQNPQWYMTNYPKQIITEFKYTYVVGLSGESYCALTTTVPWNDASGGYPKQVAKVGNKEYWRVGTSTTAWGPWNDPATTATNYMKFENNTGLVIGDMTASTLGRNVLIDSDSVDIRLGETVLASYGDNRISLGANNITSIIDLCSGTGQITASALDAGSEWWQLQLRSQNSIGLISGGEIIMNTDYSDGEWEVHNSFSMGADLPWNNETYCYSYWSVSANSISAYYQSSVDLDQNKVGITHMGPYGISTLTLDDESITLDASDTKVTGGITFADNNTCIFGTKPNGSSVAVFQPQNSSGNTVIGWDNYDKASGHTNVYGNEVHIGCAAAGRQLFRPYYHGVDSFTTNFQGAGYVTNSKTEVHFTVPVAKPIIGSPTASVTSTTRTILRQGNSYTHGSSATTGVYPSSYSATVDSSGNFIRIVATFSNTTNATNNDAIGIDWQGKITLAYG